MRRTIVAIIAGVSCLVLPLRAADSYASIDGAHLKSVRRGAGGDVAALSRQRASAVLGPDHRQ